MSAPAPLLSASSLVAGGGTCVGPSIVATVGGVSACDPRAIHVFEPTEYLHAVPPAPAAISMTVRHAWVVVFAHLVRASHPDLRDAVCIAKARQLEQCVFGDARRATAVRAALVPTVSDRQGAEVAAYMDVCRRMQAALAYNGAYLVSTYHDVSVLPHLSNEMLEVNTPAAAFREQKQCEAELAKRVLEDGGAKKEVVEGIIRCSNCGSFDVDMDLKQVRSSDEGMDLFVACNVCGKKRQYKG
jgi:DNA-directed RNA polymerase subunit M/transcription elongation factor TFIIS